MSEQTVTDAARFAAARSGLYQAFATALSSPTDEFLTTLLSGEFHEGLVLLGNELPYSINFDGTELKQSLEETNSQQIKVAYTTLFESGSQAVSLRELAYSTMTEKALLEELFRFYLYFGLEFSEGELRELPDLLPVELEFLHYLTFLEAEASSANIEALRAAQLDFVNLHPGKWIGTFLERLQIQSDLGSYALLAELLLHFIKQEKRFLTGEADSLIATD